MGFLQDPIGQKHAGYFFCLLATWIACCVIFGGELHRADIKDTEVQRSATQTTTTVTDGSYSFHYDHYKGSVTVTQTVVSSTSTSTFSNSASSDVNFKQCTSISLCNKCYSGGAGAVAMAVFAWLALLLATTLRALVLWQKHSQVPKLGESDARYALVERVTNYTAAGFFLLAIIAWGGGCMSATQSSAGVSKVIPTGILWAILCLIAVGAGIYLIHKIHEETGFGTGGAGSKSNPAQPAPAVSAPTDAAPPATAV